MPREPAPTQVGPVPGVFPGPSLHTFRQFAPIVQAMHLAIAQTIGSFQAATSILKINLLTCKQIMVVIISNMGTFQFATPVSKMKRPHLGTNHGHD